MALKNTHTGIVAGIGDKTINANVITPEFDAAIRKFAVGKNTILDGFKYESGYLTSGRCLAEGFIGGRKANTAISRNDYVYGVFTINHDSDKIDSFHLEIYDSELLNPRQDDILHAPGIYYFQIYPEVNSKRYPLKAEYSNNTTVVQSGGELENGVTCTTRPINDNSTKVANTEFVHNQIKEEINYNEAIINLYMNNQLTGKIFLYRKAKYVIGYINITTYFGPASGGLTIDNIPDGFVPKNEVNYVLLVRQTNLSNDRGGFYVLHIDSNSNIIQIIDQVNGQYWTEGFQYQSNLMIGWEIN